MRGEQRAACDGEVGFAGFAAEAERAARAAALIGVNAATGRANRRAVRRRPTNHLQHGFRFRIGHPHDLGQREGLCLGGKEEVLCHDVLHTLPT